MPELRIDAPPEPLALLRALSDREAPVLVWTRQGRCAYVAADPVEQSQELDPEPALRLGERPGGDFPRWFGLLPYEARRSLERRANDTRPPAPLARPVWRRYRAVAEITSEVRIFGESSHDADELARRLAGAHRAPVAPPGPARLTLRRPIEPVHAHRRRIERALELIARGDVYEVNLARRFEFDVEGTLPDIFEALTRSGRPPYTAVYRWPELGVVALSPELFLEVDVDGTARTSPIKGTRPRDPDPGRDRALAEELDADPKERAELAMVIDVERSDLGRVAEPGSVRLVEGPRVVSHPGVHHRVATVEARLRGTVTRGELLGAMLPSGSVTGAPKIRAMEIIAELESARRGLYTGAFGVLRHDGSLELGMAIRVLGVQGRVAHYFSGGGIVADSDPAREVEETLWKASAVAGISGASVENWA